jgi:hypothetical protein
MRIDVRRLDELSSEERDVAGTVAMGQAALLMAGGDRCREEAASP